MTFRLINYNHFWGVFVKCGTTNQGHQAQPSKWNGDWNKLESSRIGQYSSPKGFTKIWWPPTSSSSSKADRHPTQVEWSMCLLQIYLQSETLKHFLGGKWASTAFFFFFFVSSCFMLVNIDMQYCCWEIAKKKSGLLSHQSCDIFYACSCYPVVICL